MTTAARTRFRWPVKKFTGVVKGITFRRNSADIKASSFPLLKEAVVVFKEYPALRVEISGHTSDEGKRDFNMKLSRKRAEAVKRFLVSAGIDESRIGTVGYGPDKPIADNETKDGKEKNRRIEFRLLGDRGEGPDPARARGHQPGAGPRRQGQSEGEGQGARRAGGEGAAAPKAKPRRRRRPLRRPTAIRCLRRSPRQGQGRARRQGQGSDKPAPAPKGEL